MTKSNHQKLVEVACTLLKNRGFTDIRKEFPTRHETRLAKENGNYQFDACAVKGKKIVAVAECGHIPAEKFKFLLKKFKDNFVWIPFTATDYIYFIEELKSQKAKQLKVLSEKEKSLDLKIRQKTNQVEQLDKEYASMYNKRQEALNAQKQKIRLIMEKSTEVFGLIRELDLRCRVRE